jgi:hypothetical protein
VSLFQSADPALVMYLSGKPNGGVYHPINVNLYRYAAQNPLRYTDPTGLFEDTDKLQQLEKQLASPARGGTKPSAIPSLGAAVTTAIGAAIGAGSAVQTRADTTYIEELKNERGPLVNLDTTAVRNLLSTNAASVAETQAKIGTRTPVVTKAAAAELTDFGQRLSAKPTPGGIAAYGPDIGSKVKAFLQGVIVIPNVPSPAVMGVPTTDRFDAADKNIFGTGDTFKIPTITADERAVNHMRGHGVNPPTELVKVH